jgi:N-acyl-D-amino-acid deacylase
MFRLSLRIAAAVLVGVGLSGAGAATQPADFDIVIRNGRVLDGTGNPFIHADIGIRGDTIAAIGKLENARAPKIVDARDRYVTPGFMALHEHIEGDILAGRGTLVNFTTQGFTTAVINTDGRSGWPLARQRQDLGKAGASLNTVPMVGHGTVRGMAMGPDFMRAATAAEIDRMKQLVKQGMEEGAFGLSAGLEYSPGRWSTEQEVLELAKVVAPYGGLYQAHLRSQGQYPKWQLPSSPRKGTTYIDALQFTNIDAVVETINIARHAGIPVMLDHLHPKGPREWGSGRIITQLVDRAWADGHQVYINMHSYEAYDENIVLIPRWALIAKPVKGMGQYDSDRQADYTNMLANLDRRLADPEDGPLIRRDIEYDIDRQGGPDGLLIMNYPDTSLVGKTLGQVARARREDPIDTALFLQRNGFARPGGVEFRAFAVSLLDLEEFMRQDYTAVCTDRGGASVEEAKPGRFIHPGTFGTAPRRIRTFVFEKKITTLPFAIRSMTSLSAQILGLTDRGRLAPGQKADVVVFDPERLRDKATYFEPYQYSEGIDVVLVNGQFVVENGKPTGAKPGRVLERQRLPS